MQRRLVWIGGGTIAVLLIMAGAVLGFDRWADQRVAAQVQQQLETLTNEPVSIAASNIDLWQGAIQVEQLTINNPDDFSSPHLLEVASIDVDIPAAQIFSSTPVASSVVIQGVTLQFDQRLTRNNVFEVLTHLEETLTTQQQTGKPQEFQANQVLVQDATVTVTLDLGVPAVPKVTKTLPLEDFQLMNVTEETLQAELSQVMQEQILSATREWLTAEAQKWGAIGANLAIKIIQESLKSYLLPLGF